MKGPEAARLVQEIDVEYDSTVRAGRRGAGSRKLLGGGGLVAAGVGVAAVAAYFSGASGYLVFPTGLIIAGICYVAKGAVEALGG